MPEPYPKSLLDEKKLSPIKASFRSWFLIFVLALAALASLFFYIDRIACLFQSPYKSAISGWDNSFYYYWLRSSVIDGDVDFRNDISDFRTMPSEEQALALKIPLTSQGVIPNKYGVGWAVSNAPLFLATHFSIKASNHFLHTDIAEDGFGPAYQISIYLSQMAWTIFGLLAAYGILRTWFNPAISLLGILITWMGSFLFMYQVSYVSMAHNVVFSALTGIYWCTLRCQKNPLLWRWWRGIGLLSGLMLITRYQTGLYLLYPSAVAMSLLVKDHRVWPRVLLGAGLFLVMVSFQLIAWKIMFGSWLVYSYAGEKLLWFQPHLGDVLFSSHHGLFYWHPLLLISLAGFILFVFSFRGFQQIWLPVLLLTWYINAAWQCWYFGASFGSRAFEGCVLFFMIGTAFLLERSAKYTLARYALPTLLLLLVLMNLCVSFAVRKNYIPMEGPVTHREMILGLRKMTGF